MISISFAVSDDWMDFAACRGYDPDVFFCNEKDQEQVAEAKKVCESCPVVSECYKMSGRIEHGIWAGMTSLERRRARIRWMRG